MTDISKLKVGSTEYSIKDTTARSGVSTNATAIADINDDYLSYSESNGDFDIVSARADGVDFSLYSKKGHELLFQLPAATTTNAGVLTAADKVKINKIDTITKDIAGGMHFIGTTNTVLTDGDTKTTTLVAASTGSLSKTTGFIAGDMVVYKGSEFVWTGSSWALFGDLSSLGSLAYKSSASGTLPSSSHSHTFTGTAHSHTATVSGGGVSGSCVPKGSVTLIDRYNSAGIYTKINVDDSNTAKGAYLVSQRQLGTTSIKGVAGTTSVTPFGSAGSLPTGATVLTSATGSSTTISVSNETLTIPASVLTGISTTTGNALSSRGSLPTAGTAVTVATANSSQTTVATYNAISTDDSNWKSISECIIPTFTGASTTLSLAHTNPTVSISSTTAAGTVASNSAYASNSTVSVK